MKKKNPFKMWGPYLGILGFWIIPSLFGANTNSFVFKPFNYIVSLFCSGDSNCMIGSTVIFLYFYIIIVGFLLGWGIEVFLRKNKLFGLR